MSKRKNVPKKILRSKEEVLSGLQDRNEVTDMLLNALLHNGSELDEDKHILPNLSKDFKLLNAFSNLVRNNDNRDKLFLEYLEKESTIVDEFEFEPNYKHFDKQRMVFESIKDSEAKFHILRIGRSGGKTVLLLDLIFDYSIKSIEDILVTSVTNDQAKKLYEQLKSNIIKLDKKKKYIIDESSNWYNDTYRILRFKNGSKVVFKGTLEYNNLRGQNEHTIVVCDEFAFYPDDAWNMVLQQICGVAKVKKVIIASTPNGYNNFYNLWELTEHHSNYKGYHYTVESNPYGQTGSDIETARLQLPEWRFRQEYLAEFVSDGISVFTNIDNILCLDSTYKPVGDLIAGIDVGLINDYTVITILDSLCNQVGLLRFNQDTVPISDMVSYITDYLVSMGVKCVYIENNFEKSLFVSLKNSLLSNNIQADSFTTVNENKREIIDRLIVWFQLGKLKLLNDGNLRKELLSFNKVKTASGLQYTYKGSGANDDMVMSLAIACDLYSKYFRVFKL